MAKGILIAAVDFSNVPADEFNDWYDTEHIPERQRVPGFLTLQRWIGAENPRQSVATYDLDNLAVLQGPGTALGTTHCYLPRRFWLCGRAGAARIASHSSPEVFVPALAAWPAAQPRPAPPAMLPRVPKPDVLPLFSSGMNASFPDL
jgi:hypothetical protein